LEARKCSLVEAAKFLGLEWDKVQGMAYSVKWEHDYSFGVCFSVFGETG
jgi:hypothetical protein